MHVREHESGTAAATAVAALAATGRDAVVVDLTLLTRSPDPQELLLACAREALLRDAGLVAGPVEDLAEQHVEAIQRLCRWPSPVLFVGARDLGPAVVDDAPARRGGAGARGPRTDLPAPRTTSERVDADVDPDSLGAHLSLGPAQVQRAVRAAQTAALLDGGRVTRRGPARRHPGPERGRAGAAGPAHRAGGRLGRTWCWRPACDGRSRSSPPGPATATRSSWTGGCARAAAAAEG